jgi:hypothetical protein
MTKREFLAELRNALEGQIPSQDIEENIRYYDSYFRESTKTEQETCRELGDPRLIARSLIDSFVAAKGPMADYYTRQARDEYSRGNQHSDYDDPASRNASGGVPEWVDKLFRGVMIISVVIIVGALLQGILKIAIRILIFVIVAGLLIRLVRDLLS